MTRMTPHHLHRAKVLSAMNVSNARMVCVWSMRTHPAASTAGIASAMQRAFVTSASLPAPTWERHATLTQSLADVLKTMDPRARAQDRPPAESVPAHCCASRSVAIACRILQVCATTRADASARALDRCWTRRRHSPALAAAALLTVLRHFHKQVDEGAICSVNGGNCVCNADGVCADCGSTCLNGNGQCSDASEFRSCVENESNPGQSTCGAPTITMLCRLKCGDMRTYSPSECRNLEGCQCNGILSILDRNKESNGPCCRCDAAFLPPPPSL